MPGKKARQPEQMLAKVQRRRSRVLIAVVVVMSLVGVWTVLAYSGAFNSASGEKGSKKQPVSTASFASPSKEYIYAGGRLVATEEPAAATPPYQGSHDGAGCNTISGWAWDPNNPSGTVSVDVYDGTSTLLGTVAANLYREDLLNVLNSAYHGFSFSVPSTIKNNQPHSITVKFAGTSTGLSNTPRTITCSGAATAYQGFHDAAGCNTIAGWAWDQNDPYGTIDVDIYDGTTVIAKVPATQYRPDLASAGIGNGYHGFSFLTPANLKNNQPHSITVKVSGTNISLGNTPRTITCSGAAPIYQGYHDATSCNTISGWAWDRNDPNMPVNVAIYDNGTLLGVITALQFRQDLLNAGIGNGYHGFSFATSLSSGSHTITVKFSGTSTKLAQTDQQVSCP